MQHGEDTPYPNHKSRREGRRDPELPIVGWADWYLDEVVEAQKVTGYNAYNVSIAEERVHRLFNDYHCWSACPPRLSVNADMLDRRPSAKPRTRPLGSYVSFQQLRTCR
jgi:hypothetical protein